MCAWVTGLSGWDQGQPEVHVHGPASMYLGGDSAQVYGLNEQELGMTGSSLEQGLRPAQQPHRPYHVSFHAASHQHATAQCTSAP